MKIKIYYDRPILEINKSMSAGEMKDFGLTRDRFPDRDHGELSSVNIELNSDVIKEVELTQDLKIRLLGDLAYVYGRDSKKFENKLKEFELI